MVGPNRNEQGGQVSQPIGIASILDGAVGSRCWLGVHDGHEVRVERLAGFRIRLSIDDRPCGETSLLTVLFRRGPLLTGRVRGQSRVVLCEIYRSRRFPLAFEAHCGRATITMNVIPPN